MGASLSLSALMSIIFVDKLIFVPSTRLQTLQDFPRPQVRVHDDGGVPGRRGVDAAQGPRLVRGPHGALLHGLRGGGARVPPRQEHHLQGPQAGKPLVGLDRLREAGE